MDGDEVGEEFAVIHYVCFLAQVVFLSKLTSEGMHLPYITFFPNLGQHWAAWKLSASYFPYSPRNLGDVAHSSTERGKGDPHLL